MYGSSGTGKNDPCLYGYEKYTALYVFYKHDRPKKQKKENGRFFTTKGTGHGYGLVRIDTIIERCQGYISRNSEDGAFTTEILLPQ